VRKRRRQCATRAVNRTRSVIDATYSRRRMTASGMHSPCVHSDLPEAELEKYLDDKYGTSRAQAISGDMMDEDEYDDITRQGLLPSQKDPNLW
jgi:hypothetical protein